MLDINANLFYIIPANVKHKTILGALLMEIELKDIGEHKVISVSGEVDLYNVSELKKALFSVTDGSYSSVVVDLKDVNYMDSSGIGALVAGQKKMRAHNGKFALINIHDDVLNILKLATLDRFFTIYEDENDLI
jgi:anti-anti-sigma factor